jgi:hypothetical protein
LATCGYWACVALHAQQQAAAKNPYVGLKYGPRVPAGLKDFGGGLISDPYKDKEQYGMAHVAKGTVHMVWFEIMTHQDSEGRAHWEVLDVITTPTLRPKQELMLTLCTLNNQPDPEIVALIDLPPRGSYVTRTRKAWRANRLTRKFEEIPIRGVKCEMQGDE